MRLPALRAELLVVGPAGFCADECALVAKRAMTDAGHLDLSYSAEQDALADSVRGVVAWHIDSDDPAGIPHRVWKALAELGVLGLATPEGGGGAQEIAAVMEVLGEAGTPGPLVATFMATQLVTQPERDRLARGDGIASIGSPPLMPWAPVADVFVELSDDGAWLARPAGDIESRRDPRRRAMGPHPAGPRRCRRRGRIGDGRWSSATSPSPPTSSARPAIW